MAVAELVVKVGADISALTRGLDQASSKVKGFGRKISGVGKGLTAGVTLPVIGIGIAAVKSAVDFDRSMKNIQSISHGTDAEIKALGKTFTDWSTDITKSTDTALGLSEAFYEVQGSGFAGAEALHVLEVATKGATAGLSDTEIAAGALTSVLNAYGMTAADSMRIQDLLFKTVDIGVVSYEELAGSIGKVTGTAAAAGVEFADVTAAIATMTKKGYSGAESVTSINQALLSWIKPSGEATKLAKELGIQFDADALASKGFAGALEEVMVATDGDIEALAKFFPNVRALRGVLALTEGGMESFTEDQKAMADSLGATDEAFKIQSQSADAMLKSLKNLGMAALKDIGEEILPILLDVVKAIRPMIEAFRALPGPVKKGIIIFGLLAAVVGPLLIVIGSVVSAIATIGGVFTGLAGIVTGAIGAIAGAAAPILLVIAAIALAVGVLYLAWKNNWLGMRDTLEIVWNAIKATFERIKTIFRSIGQWMSGAITFDQMAATIKRQLSGIADVWSYVWDKLTAKVREVGAAIAMAASNIKDKVLGFIEGLKSGFLGKLADMVSRAAGIVAGLVSKIFGALTGGSGGGGFELDLSAIGALKNMILGAMEIIKAAILEMSIFTSTTIIAWLALVQSSISTTWAAISTDTITFLTTLQTTIIASLTTLYQFIVGWLETVRIAFVTVNMQILTNTITTWQMMVAAVIQQANYMRTTVVMIVTAMAEQIKAILQGLADAGRKAGEALAQGVADGIKARQGAAVAAAMAMAAAVRAALPSSDAKKGPLSDLTNAGRALPKTFAKGIQSNAGVVAKAANALASNVCPAVRQAAVCAGNAGAGLGGGGNGNAPAPPLTNAAAKAKDPTSNSQNININVNNPNGETTNASVTRQLRNLAYLGMLSNEAGANA